MTRELGIAWAAGLFEGEGCITGRIGGTDIVAAIVMRDEDCIRRFAAIAGVGTVTYQAAREPNRSPMWRWQANGSDAERVIVDLLPLLGVRRTARAREFLARRQAWRAEVMAARDCAYCGVAFCPTTGDQHARQRKYCTPRCRLRAIDHAYRRRNGALSRGTHTHCRNGHKFTEKNTAIRGGFRSCRTCEARRSRESYARRKARA